MYRYATGYDTEESASLDAYRFRDSIEDNLVWVPINRRLSRNVSSSHRSLEVLQKLVLLRSEGLFQIRL